MTEKRSYKKGLILLGALAAVTVLVLLKGYRPADLWEAFLQADKGWLLLGCFCMALFVTCEAVNIRLIMKSLGRTLPFGHCEQYAFVGFYFSSITPSSGGGQPMQVYYMKKDKIPIADSSAAILFIVLVYQIAMLLFAGIMAAFHSDMAGASAGQLNYLLLYGGLVNGAMAVLLAVSLVSETLVGRIAGLFIRLLARLHLVRNLKKAEERAENEIREYGRSTGIMKKNPLLFLKVLAVTLVQMGALATVPYCVYRALGFAATSWGNVMTAQSLLTLASSAVPLPGAVGAAEGGFLWAFQTIFPAQSVKTAMLVSRGISFYLFLLVSFLVCAGLQLRVSKSKQDVDTFEKNTPENRLKNTPKNIPIDEKHGME